MIIDLNDIYSILKISIILLFSSFSLFFPLTVLLKSHKLALKYTIPLSIIFQILIGYYFYCFGPINFYPIFFLIAIGTINIVAVLRLVLQHKFKHIGIEKKQYLYLLVLFACFIPIFFTRFYDAVVNIAPGTIDTAAHYRFIFYDLDKYGYLSSPFYAPGYQLLLYPLKVMVAGPEVYRFAGPVLGIITILATFLLLKDTFKNKRVSYLLLLFVTLPIFNQLTLQTIGFFSSALTFLILPFLVVLIIASRDISPRVALFFYLMGATALSLTVPYLYVQYIPALFLFVLAITITKRQFGSPYVWFVWKLLAVTLVGFFFAYGHVYLQTNILGRGGGFPSIDSVKEVNGEFVTSNSSSSTNDVLTKINSSINVASPTETVAATATATTKEFNTLAQEKKIIEAIANNKLFQNYILPSLMTGKDVLRIKNIRPLNSTLSKGAYLWILICLIGCYFVIKKKKIELLLVIAFSIIFGYSTQTGALEMSTYRGRSGWYLLFFAVLGLLYFIDLFIHKIPKKLLYIIFPILFLIGFTNPPTYYRSYYTEPFTEAMALSKQYPDQNILFITNESKITIISDKIFRKPLVVESLTNKCPYHRCYLILEKQFLNIDPIQSQKALAIDKDFKKFKIQQTELKSIQEQTISDIMASPIFMLYKIYWENKNLAIYEFAY